MEKLFQLLSHLERSLKKRDFMYLSPTHRTDLFELENVVVITSVVLFTRYFISCYCLLSGHRGSQMARICRNLSISTFPRFMNKFCLSLTNPICNHICHAIYYYIYYLHDLNVNLFRKWRHYKALHRHD